MAAEGDYISIRKWLLPVSWVYGLVVRLRNMLFDSGILKERSYPIPIISVGNITVGGTGKTPHVEYIIGLLKDKMKVGLISRGYKRRTRGYVRAGKDSTSIDIGDELMQVKEKYPGIAIAADARRRRAVERLEGETDVLVMDDGFQHRYVKPGLNILLVDWHRIVTMDELMPAGRLREPLKGKDRADVVIVSKCPEGMKPMDYRVISKQLGLYPYQKLFFSRIVYDKMRHYTDKRRTTMSYLGKENNILLLTGIASPRHLIEDLRPKGEFRHLKFPDHHRFRPRDMARINEAYREMPKPAIIITTEKDAVRLRESKGLDLEVERAIYVLPVKVEIMLDQEETFKETILDYVRKNTRNGILAERQDDHKSSDGYNIGDRPRTISFRN